MQIDLVFLRGGHIISDKRGDAKKGEEACGGNKKGYEKNYARIMLISFNRGVQNKQYRESDRNWEARKRKQVEKLLNSGEKSRVQAFDVTDGAQVRGAGI